MFAHSNRLQFIRGTGAALVLGGAQRLAADADTETILRVATTPTEAGAAVYYAQDLGFFKDAGVRVDISSGNSGAADAAAVAAGSLDIVQSSLPSIASAHERNIPFVLVAPGAVYTSKAPTSALVVSKSSPIKTAKDLIGKTIANNALKNIGEIAADAWLDAGGADVASVRIIELPLPAMASALEQGRIDAAILVEPSLGEALAGNARVLAYAYSSIASTFLLSAYFATPTWAKANSDSLRRFQSALRKASHWANQPENHKRSGELLQKYMQVTPGPSSTRVTYGESLELRLMQPVIDAAAKYHVLKATFPAAEIVYR